MNRVSTMLGLISADPARHVGRLGLVRASGAGTERESRTGQLLCTGSKLNFAANRFRSTWLNQRFRFSLPSRCVERGLWLYR